MVRKVYQIAQEQRVFMTEAVWKNVKNETRRNVLCMLYLFLLANNEGLRFCEMRMAILMHPEIWGEIAPDI